jgi:hypothetical protein
MKNWQVPVKKINIDHMGARRNLFGYLGYQYRLLNDPANVEPAKISFSVLI